MLPLMGVVLGVIIGAVTGHSAFAGGFVGMLLGGGAGLLLQAVLAEQVARRVQPLEAKIEHIYKSLGDIHFRLKALEDARAEAIQARPEVEEKVAPAKEQPVPPVTVPPTAAPIEVPPSLPPLEPVAPAPAMEAPVARAPVDATPETLPEAPAIAAAMPAPATREIELPLAEAAPAPSAPVESAPAELELLVPAAEPAPRAVAPDKPAAVVAKVEEPVEPVEEDASFRPALPRFITRLFEGNVVAKAGVVILFFGVGFLLKYAYDHSVLPPWVRLLAVAAASTGLFYAGRRLLEKRRLYAVILMGCGVGFLYLDIFFALRWYHYIGATFGFALFMALGVATVLAAVRMDARALAVLGLFGAFLAPPLASTGGGSHIILFSYYTLLNLFILGVSWFKAWRDLNLVGFGFTFVISLFWGASNYQPALFSSVEPFVIAFFLIYLAIPVLFATRQQPELRGLVDGTLVFGTPIACAFMQARLVAGMGDHALAWSAGLAGALYAVLGLAMRRRPLMQVLAEAHLALAVLLLTMAIFFAFDAYPTFALWTLEGAAIVWVGLRQRRVLARLFGLALQVGAALYFLGQYPHIEQANPLFNDFVFGCALVAVAAWLTAAMMDRRRELLDEAEAGLGYAMLGWGWLWWLGGGLHAIYCYVDPVHFASVALMFASLSLLLGELVGARLPPAGWPALRRVAALQVVFMAAAMLWPDAWSAHPLQGMGGLAWPLAFAVHFWVLHRHRSDALQAGEETRETLGWLLLAVLATWDAGWLIAHGEHALALLWALAGFAAGWLRHRLREQEEQAAQLARFVLAWAIAVWGAAGGGWLATVYTGAQLAYVCLAGVAISTVLFEVLGRAGDWGDLRRAGGLQLPAMLVMLVVPDLWPTHPLQGWGVAAWPLAFASHFWVLARHRRDALDAAQELRGPAGWLLFAVLATWDAGWLITHGEYALALLWALVGFVVGWLRHTRYEQEADAFPLSRVVLAWSVVVWSAAGGGWLADLYDGGALVFLCLAGVAVSTALFELLGRLGNWADMRRAAGLLLPAMLAALVMLRYHGVAPLDVDGWWVWPLAFAAAWGILWRQESDECAQFAGVQHVLLFWMLAGIWLWQVDARLHQQYAVLQWLRAAWGALPAALVLAVTVLARRDAWPWRNHAHLYRDVALAPLLVIMGAWSVFANIADPGAPVPSFHIPLLNPLDLAQALVLWAAWTWAREAQRDWSIGRVKPALGAAAFIWVNGIALRAIHYYADVPYEIHALLASVLTQSVLSLLWTACALVLMTWASRRHARIAWGVGAALLGVVVLKLVLNDLGNSGTVARIVSFLGVGVMLLVIGYVAPLPPGEELTESDGRG